MESVYCTTSVWPKPGFGIGNRNQGPILVLELKLFLLIFFFSFFFSLFHVFPLLGTVLKSLKLNTHLQKYLIFGSKLGFRGPFILCIGNYISSIEMLWYQPKNMGHFGFRFWTYIIPNRGFGRTLPIPESRLQY